MLLWLWCRPAAVAAIWPLAWELPYAMGRWGPKKWRKKKSFKFSSMIYFELTFSPLVLSIWLLNFLNTLSLRTICSPLKCRCSFVKGELIIPYRSTSGLTIMFYWSMCFLSFFRIYTTFISFACPIALARISITMLTKNGKRGHTSLFSILVENYLASHH